MGQHRGKGPKGYQRSDERIKELICERLREDPHIDPGEVTINVQGGKVTLEGTVDSRQAKNSIEDIAEQFGVQEVQNNLRVQKGTSTPGPSMGQPDTQSEAGRPSRGAGDDHMKPKQH
jgi:osmotically-inducible protein OsmY